MYEEVMYRSFVSQSAAHCLNSIASLTVVSAAFDLVCAAVRAERDAILITETVFCYRLIVIKQQATTIAKNPVCY